ncbi:hypothetical protein MALU111345_14565 [Marinicrinis lubricantis]
MKKRMIASLLNTQYRAIVQEQDQNLISDRL